MKNLKQITKVSLMALSAVLVLFLNACKKEDSNPTPGTPSSGSFKGVFIINEGNFQKGNATVDFYDPSKKELTESVFSKNNNNLPLGDIFQSMVKVDNKFYLVVNNSGKIEIVNATDFKTTASIKNLGSPRYLQPLSATGNKKAYVTDFFSGEISIIDLSTYSKTGTISLPGWNEHMVDGGAGVLVSSPGNNKVYTINTTSNMVTDSLSVSGFIQGMVKDKNGKAWVLTDSSGANPAKLYLINPNTAKTERVLEMPAGVGATKLAINGAGDMLYYINSIGVFDLPITSNLITGTSLRNGYYYGMGIDPNDGNIYLSDPIDYNQKGNVIRFDPNKGDTVKFKAGVIPGGFYFNY